MANSLEMETYLCDKCNKETKDNQFCSLFIDGINDMQVCKTCHNKITDIKYHCSVCNVKLDNETSLLDFGCYFDDLGIYRCICADCEIVEKEYSVTITGSWGVLAESKESAEQWILDQFYNGNINYTSDVEIDNGK